MSKKVWTPILLSLLVMAIWGSLFPFVQWGFKEFQLRTSDVSPLGAAADSLLYAGIRFFISGLIISIISFIKKENVYFKKNNKAILGVVLVGLFAVLAHYACTYLGLLTVSSTYTALLKQSGALIFVCFSFIFVKDDKFSIFKVLGAIVGIGAICFINYEPSSMKFDFTLGSLFVIIASLCTVISNIFYKKFLTNAPSFAVTGFSQLIGGIFLLIIGLSMGGRISHISPLGVVIFIYTVVATIVSYWLWYKIAKDYELSKLYIIKMSEPLFAALVSYLIKPLNATISYKHAIAFGLVAIAIVLSNVKLKKKEDSYESDACGKSTTNL